MKLSCLILKVILIRLITWRKAVPAILVVVLWSALIGCAVYSSGKEKSAFIKRTYIYKSVGGVEIKADVYRPEGTKPRPVVVWLHGGALVMGSRDYIPEDIRELCRDEGFVLVSLDYRLAPEVKLPAIIDDIRDAFSWIREEGPDLFGADTERMVVTGESAGGYLTMMTGICVEPRPTALVAYYGYGDVDGEWYTEPSTYYLENEPLLSKDEAYKAVGSEVLTGTTDETVPSSEQRDDYYHYLRQHGLWTVEVSGFDPETEREKITPYCPVRNITPEYPSLMMLHGTADNDVPYEKSAAMAQELTRHDVGHELITIDGAGHGLWGGDENLTVEAYQRARAFIKKHLE